MKRVLSLIILATATLIAQPESDVPNNMSFQGLLTDTEGIAYDDGEYQLTFRLIREMNDGTQQTVWEEIHSTNVSNGVFSVILGNVNPLPLNISPNVLLETQVGDEILSPRQRLTSVPFALKSSRAQQAYQSVLSDTANVAHNALHAIHSDTAHFLFNMPVIDSVMFAEQANHSTYADTAQYVFQAQSALTANQAEISNNAIYSDTAQYVFQAQSALTSLTSENSTNAVYADTASYVLNSGSPTSINDLSDATTEGYGNIGLGGGVLGMNEGGYNLAVGYDALKFNVSASFNTALGHKSLWSNTNGEKNIAVGYSSLYENVTGSQNTSTGYEAMQYNTGGSYNSAYGFTSLRNNVGGSNNVAFGMAALYNTQGDNNTAIGRNAGMMNTTGTGNVFIGFSAGNNANYQTASNKLAIANSSTETPLIDGDFSDQTLRVYGELTATTMSTYALTTNGLDVSGDVAVTGAVTANSFSGDGSGLTGISGGATSINDLSDALVESSSMYIGEDPSSTTSSAGYNVSVGITALENITSGNQNVAVGFNALEENTTGERNVGIGYQALENTSTGSQNTAVGRTSLPFNTSGDGNTALGDFTLYYNSTGDGNIAIGQAAGQNNTTGSNNVFIGKQAGSNSGHSTASDKLVIANTNTTTPLIDGDFDAATLTVNGALTANSVAAGDVSATEFAYLNGVTSAIQTQIDAKQAADDDLTDLADGTLSASKVENNEYFISSAGTANQVWTSDGSGAGAWSASSGATNVTGLSDALVEDNSIYIGNDPSSTTNSSEKNIAVGTTALRAVTVGDNNVAIGYNSLYKNTSGSNNMAVGTSSLEDNIGGDGNSAIGYRSLYENVSGDYNSAIGSYSARENTTGDKNVAVGNSSLRENTTGNKNTAVGQGSGFSIIGGNDNTTVGQLAGNIITTGSNNVIIGSESDPSAGNATNQIVIGKSAVGHGDNIAVIGNTDITAIHPADDNGVDLGSSSYSYKDAHIQGTANIGVLNLGVNSTITSSTTFNGTATVIPVNTSGGAVTLTIDSDQKVAGRILIIKKMTADGSSITIATEGSEQVQCKRDNISDTYTMSDAWESVHLFCDGSNWYDLLR